MRTVDIFYHDQQQTICIPKEMEFVGVTELEIHKEGNTLILRPVRPTWLSLVDEPVVDADFLQQRSDVF